jgi:hypothetical protein
MVTVGYEQAKGLRAKHQRESGDFAVSVSRTIAAPAGMLFDAWADESERRRWLGDPAITIRRATRSKSMRILWEDGTRVNVSFSGASRDKTLVAVDHEKLASAADVARKKKIWDAALTKLKSLAER